MSRLNVPTIALITDPLSLSAAPASAAERRVVIINHDTAAITAIYPISESLRFGGNILGR